MADFPWTDEHIKILRDLTAEGKSAGYIGNVLGCTKNACIGKRNRLGLRLARGDVRESLPPRPRSYEPKFGKPVPIVELHHLHCKAIVDRGKYCAQPVHRRSFCDFHFRLFYVAQQAVARKTKVFA